LHFALVAKQDVRLRAKSILVYGPEPLSQPLVLNRHAIIAWGIFEDIMEDNRFLETFLVESWLEYLRQHEGALRDAGALWTR
jgi:hypothetical protein